MARKKQEKVSLLPFLDIMTATMGTLILILISVTLLSVTQESKKVYLKLKSTKKEEGVKLPYFLICERERLVILHKDQAIGIRELESDDSPFFEFTNQIDRRKQYIIFAVRPDGIESFKKARRLVEDLGIDIGYEPVNQHWQIKIEKSLEKLYASP